MELIDLVNSVIISSDLTQMVSFPTQISDCALQSCSFEFISSDDSICSKMVFHPLGNSDHVVSVSIGFLSNSHRDAPFHGIAYHNSRADWDSLRDHLRNVLWKDSFKFTSAVASKFCEWIQVGTDVYIPHHKCQVKPYSSPWFSAACAAAAIVHRNHLVVPTINLLNLKEASNSCKRVLEAAKLACANKNKGSTTFQKLGCRDFSKLLVFLTKVNLLHLFYSTAWRCCLLHLIKQNLLLKTFLRTQILITRVSLYLFFFLELI